MWQEADVNGSGVKITGARDSPGVGRIRAGWGVLDFPSKHAATPAAEDNVAGKQRGGRY